ncbi:MAG: type II secretion system inner membrane protein GspF [Pseudomonadota bacterium]
MPAFDYIALDPGGRKRKGVVEGDSPRQVRQQLRDKQFTPLEVREARTQSSSHSGISAWQGFGSQLSGNELALVTRQIATLLQAGLSVEESLSVVGRQSERRSTSRVLLAVRAKVREGFSLADSLKQHPRTFNSLYCATAAAGEQSGHLDTVMLRLADYTESQQQFRQKVQMAMVYPVLLLLLSLAIVSGLMIYVVPDMVQVITDAGQQLPLLTEILIAVSGFMQRWLVLILGLAVVATLVLHRLLQQPQIKLRWHRLQLCLPLLGKVLRNTQAARYISTLAILTNSGIPLVEAMRIAAPVTNNIHFQQQLAEAGQRVREGVSLNQALEHSALFPPMMIQLIISGESSGELPAMLQKAAHIQENELQRMVTLMVTILEPATLVLMGGFVLLIVLAVMLPILNMNQMVS